MNSSQADKSISPAHRVTQVKEYYFSTKLKEIARLNQSGAGIISLAVGGPDLPPSREAIDTLCTEATRPGAHGYQSYTGIPELRQAYASWYRRYFGVGLNPDSDILPLIGSKEGIMHITMAFVNPGDGVLVPNPGYPTYSSVSRLAEAELFSYDLTPQNGWMPDFAQLEQLPLHKIKLMWVNYPNMPTGRPATAELFRRLVDFGRRHGIVIVNDNPYSFILNDSRISILSTPGAADVAIELNSMSKSHNIPGWRMAMAASNPTFINWILKIKSNIDSGQFRPIMLAAAKALDAGDDWYAGINSEYASRRTHAEAIMTALHCSFDTRQTGLFLWGRIPDSAASSVAFADEVLQKAKVFIVPGVIFGSNGDRYVRISLCEPPAVLSAALQRISSAQLSAF